MHGRIGGLIVAAMLMVANGAITPDRALAQSGGVTTPAPGSAPTVSGPNSVNPSAAASDLRSPSAVNPSSAVSATGTPNALNPSGTPSTFAPVGGGVSGSGLRQPLPTARSRVRSSRAAARRAGRRTVQSRRPAASVERPNARLDQKARNIVGSVCRGC